MSVQGVAWARAQHFGSSIDRLILVLYGDHANDEGVAWPSRDRIAADAGVSPRTAQRSIARLRAAGLLRPETKGNQWSGPTRYRLMMGQMGLTITAGDKLSPARRGAQDTGGGVHRTLVTSAQDTGVSLIVKNRSDNRQSYRSVGERRDVDPAIGSAARGREPTDPASGGLGLDVGEFEGEGSVSGTLLAEHGIISTKPCRPGCDGWCGGEAHYRKQPPDRMPAEVYQAVSSAIGIRSREYLSALAGGRARVRGVSASEIGALARAAPADWLAALRTDELPLYARPRLNPNDDSIATGWLCKRVATMVFRREELDAPAEQTAAAAGGRR